jgi:hypothetical protein
VVLFFLVVGASGRRAGRLAGRAACLSPGGVRVP